MITNLFIRLLIILMLFSLAINIIYLAFPLFIMIVYDKVLYSYSTATLATLSLGVLLSLLAIGLLDYFRMKMLGQFANNMMHQFIPSVLTGMHHDASSPQRQGYSRGLHDLECIRDALVQGRFLSVLDFPWMALYLALIFYIHPLIGGVTTIALFIIMVLNVLLFKFTLRRFTIADVTLYYHANRACSNFIAHNEIVAALGMKVTLIDKFQTAYNTISASRSEAENFWVSVGAISHVLHLATLASVLLTGVYVFFLEQVNAGMILAVVVVTARLLTPLAENVCNMKTMVEAIAAYKRLGHFLAAYKETNKLTLPPPLGKFEMEAATLVLSTKPIVSKISFMLEPGESIGIVGPSSAGKTSLCKMVVGIWPTTTGKVRLDGADLEHWPEEELKKYIGYAPQEAELFPGTVAQNIARLGEVDSEKVMQAARKAGIHELIMQLPRSYDTQIDETEKNLAAGQRQLISLARAMYNDPKIVLFDEPHSFLDDLGLRMVLHALDSLRQEKVTVIVVTDRTNLLLKMDKLLVMDKGQMVQYGPRQMVLEQLANRQQQSQQTAGA